MEKTDFETFWNKLTDILSSEKTIRNWTKDKGSIGEDFIAEPKGVDYVTVSAPSAMNTQMVPKADFKLVYDKWQQY